MIFTESPLAGVYLVEMDRIIDDRGFFARSFCAAEFEARGLAGAMSQCSVSFNALKGTLRGLHFQAAPHQEDKLVRCTAGAIFDVVVDVRVSGHLRSPFQIPEVRIRVQTVLMDRHMET